MTSNLCCMIRLSLGDIRFDFTFGFDCERTCSGGFAWMDIAIVNVASVCLRL